MQQRIAYLIGRTSFLLHGDDEVADRRFMATDENGAEVPAAIPQLLREGWQILSVHPYGEGKDGAIVLLQHN